MVPETHETHHVMPRDEKLRALIENISSYIEFYHGGFVEFVSIDKNVLKDRLGGACDGCSLSKNTLYGWVGGTVRQFFPDITEIIAV